MKKKLFISLLATIAALCCVFAFSACFTSEEKGEDGHTHIADTYSVYDNSHWKICTVCGEQFANGNHKFGQDNSCSVCDYSTKYTEGLQFSEIKDDAENVIAYEVAGIDEETVTEIVIPSYYNGKSVTTIGRKAFRWCKSFTSIIIPNSVTTIGSEAFCDCDGLTSISIPNSVTQIGSSAFYDTAYFNDEKNWEENVL